MKARAIEHICQVCGNKREVKLSRLIINERYAIRCAQCGLESVYPLPSVEEVKSYYSKAHLVSDDDISFSDDFAKLFQPVINYLVGNMTKRDKPLHFLDYGFGSGGFLKQVAKNGYFVCGVEINDSNLARLISYFNKINFQCWLITASEVNQENLKGKSYDCITLFSVIEHLINPIMTLSSLSRLQNKNDILYIECPNNEAFFLKFKNMIRKELQREDFFNSLNPPYHLYGFNKNSLAKLLQNSGYDLMEIDDFCFADGLHQPETMYWYPSLSRLLRDRDLWNLYTISKCLAKMFEPMASFLCGGGGGLFALARKR